MTNAKLPSGDQNEAGFSLVEVLVALLLVSVMAASLAAMAGQFRQIAQNTTRNLELAALQSAARHIAKQVERAEELPLDHIQPNGSFLLGRADEVQFVATVRLGTIEQSLRTIMIDLRDDLEVVQANWMRRPGAGQKAEVVSDIQILDDVQSLEFRYLDRDKATGSPVWRQSWDTVDQLPSAVAVTLTKLDKTKRPMMSTAVAWFTPN